MSASAQPGWTIIRSIWWRHRRGFGGLLALALVGAGVFQIAAPHFSHGEGWDAVGYLSMGLSLFLTFAFCGFTESDRRARFEGYPSRLFTLPVKTRTLVGAPILFGVTAVLSVYAVWSQFVLPRMGRELPWLWPSGYLAAGMLCHQSLLWALARFRVARLFALGLGGALLSSCWIVFREEYARDVLAGVSIGGIPARRALGVILGLIAAGALVVAYRAVESDRRGRGREGRGWRRWLEWVLDALPRGERRFSSPGGAQLWWEWRRHGVTFPAITTVVLLAIMVPAIFAGPLDVRWTALCLALILITPLLLAFALGKGFGKTDLWSSSSAPSLFLATRPLTIADRIAAKMKAAALAAITSWAILILLTMVWLRFCGNSRLLTPILQWAASFHPSLGTGGMLAILATVSVLLTWRLLAGSLYLGMAGRTWMPALAALWVFAAIFAGIFFFALLSDRPETIDTFLHPPRWWSPMLALLFVAKTAGAGRFAMESCRRGWIAPGSAWRYFGVWLLLTGMLASFIWMAIPTEAECREVSLWLALLTVPLLRVSVAPLALTLARKR